MRASVARLIATASAALATVTVLAPAAAQAAECTPKLSAGPESYDVRLCGIPDFDQRRIAATSVGAAKYAFTGLPFDGEYSCGPTSLTNLLGYYVRRGLADSPVDYPWETRVFAEQAEPQNPSAYNTAGYSKAERAAYEGVTSVIDLINPKIDPSGTNLGTLSGQLDAVLGQLSDDVAFTYASHTFDADAPRLIAAAIANGATVLVGGEAFESGSVDAAGVRNLGARAGGHALTVRGIKGRGDRALILMRDPYIDETVASDEGKTGDRVRQSTFMTQLGSLRRTEVRFPPTSVEGGSGGTDAIPSRTTWAYGGEVVQAGVKRRRYLTTWLALYPQTVVYKSPRGFSAIAELVHPGAPLGLGTEGRPVTRSFDVGPVADATFVPQSSEVVFARRGSRVVEAVNVVSRARRVLTRAPGDVLDLETDALRGEVLVLGTEGLVRQPVTTGQPAVIRPATGFDAIAQDRTGDRVALVSLRRREIRLYDGRTLTSRRAGTLPAGALDGDGGLLAAFDGDGRLLLRRSQGTTLQRVDLGEGVALLEPVPVRGAGLVVDDDGAVLTSVGGRVQSIDRSGEDIRYRRYEGAGQLVSLINSSARIDDRAYIGPFAPEIFDVLQGRPSLGLIGTESLPDEPADAAQDALSF